MLPGVAAYVRGRVAQVVYGAALMRSVRDVALERFADVEMSVSN